MPPTNRPLIPSVSVDRNSTLEQQTEAERLLFAAVVASSNDAILTKTLDGIITELERRG